MILDGHDVDAALAHLADLEADFRHLAGAQEGGAVFRVAGRWLVEEGYLRGLLRSKLGGMLGAAETVPVIGDLKAAPLVMAAVFGPRIRGRSSAVAVCFKQNVRAFYLGSRAVTVKVAGRATRGRGLRREIEVRTRIGKPAGVVLPLLIAGDRGPHPYLWEEIVFGRRLDPERDGELFLRDVLPRILDAYEGWGIRYAIASDFLDLEALAADVLAAADQIDWSPEWVDRARFRSGVAACGEESDKYLLVGTGHGDLSAGNILITEGKEVCLLDWERSREQILMRDLEKVFRQFPGSWALAVSRMGSWRPPEIALDRVISCSRQALLGTLQLIQSISRIRQQNKASEGEWAGRMTRQTDRILAKEFSVATLLLEEGRL